MEIKEKDYLKFKADRYLRNLFTGFLSILEEVDKKYEISDQDFEFYRRRILDNGNQGIRDLQEEIEKIATLGDGG